MSHSRTLIVFFAVLQFAVYGVGRASDRGVRIAIPAATAIDVRGSELLEVRAKNAQTFAQVRSFEYKGISYPDSSLHIPVSFVASNKSRVYGFAHYVNRVRNKRLTYGCQPQCSDAEISVDFVVFANNTQSLTIQPGLQSISSRNGGTSAGQGGYLGFRFSRKVSNTLAFSLGGESIIRLDSTVDLGRNAFVGISKLYELSTSWTSGPVVVNLGLGSGAFSLFGNSLISTGYRSDREHKNSDADNFDFGLVGSVSYSPFENLTLGLEYSGYGVGFGPSFRPIPSIPLVATFYIYDLLWEPDLPFDATPNLFGNLTYRF